ncbi:hypothetical protein BGZ96_003726, partial [Linnemannia gamsii]
MSTLQFSTRAQAMGFLINLLQSFQQEPCECDLVQGCFCSPEGVEDHSGLAPCYVCGEWYAEEVYCTGSGDDQDSSYRKVDGRSWHERGGASLRHQVAETRVRQWLDQVVVPVASAATWTSSPYYYQQQQQQQQQQPHHHHSQLEQQQEQQQSQSTPTATGIRSRPGRSASCPATFSIPEEIMDPSIRRTPGFRIKRRDTIATERPASLPSSVEQQVLAPTSYSAPSSASSTLVNNSKSTTPFFRFSFTSERFNAAIQESLSRRSSTASSSSTVVPQQPSPSTNNNTTVDSQAEAVAEQTEAESGTEAEAETETQAEEAVTTTAAETETALTSAQTTPSVSSFVSSPSSHSRGCSPHSSAGKVDQRDQYGVAEEAATNVAGIVSTVAQQPFSCTTTSLSSSTFMGTSTSTSTSTSTGTGTTFSTFSFGKPQLDSPPQAAVIPAGAVTHQDQQQQRSQEAGRGRTRRRGQGHVRQQAQSHILVMGSSFHQPLFPPPLPQSQPQQSAIGETSDPKSMVIMSPPCPSSSSATPRFARSQHGLLMSSPVSSPPLASIIKKKKKTVSFALPLPLPCIVITPPEENEEEAVAEWQSCCNTLSSSLSATTNNIDNIVAPHVNSPRASTTPTIPIRTIKLPSSTASTLTRLLQQVLQSAIALGWWS